MGKTLLSLFSDFDKEELCQLYVHPATPDIVTCNSYYRVTDREILKSLYSFKSAGRKLEEWEVVAERNSSNISVMQRNPNNDRPSRRLLRDIMWKMSHWYTKALRTWLDEEQPTCIFLAPGYAKFIYDIALKIADEYKLPIISYICDDYYFVKESKGLIGSVQLSLLRRKTEKLFLNTSYLITISDEIKNQYMDTFKIPAKTVMTGTNYKIEENIKVCKEPKTISYFGNVGYNRFISLKEIGQALEQINEEIGKDYKLKVYTSEKCLEVLQVLGKVKSIELQDFVQGEEFDRAMHSAELLLHVEAFDEESIDIVKHSISTKIADGLGSGIPLIAYGPECISSMKYLIKNECALAVTKKEELKQFLLEVFRDREKRVKASTNALSVAHKYHECGYNSKVIKQIAENLQREKNERFTEKRVGNT